MISDALSPVAGRWLQRRGEGQRLGREGFGLDHEGRSTPPKPRYVWVKEEGEEPDWENLAKLLPPPGFRVLPRRWVVERTFSWIDQNRRMSKDYERLPETCEAFVYVAMSRLMVRRLAHV